MDNYANVLTSVRAMTDTSRYGLSYSRISLSTVGVVPRMYQLIQDMPDVSLAISLHAPNQVGCACALALPGCTDN